MAPEGWLIDPKAQVLLLFHRDPMSCQRFPKFYMDKWTATKNGTPHLFKNRRKVELEPASETWSELIQNGWTQVNELFGNAA